MSSRFPDDGQKKLPWGQRSWRQHRFSSAKQNKRSIEGLKKADELAELEKEEGVPVEDLRAYFKDIME